MDLFFYRDPEETREQDEEGGEFTGAAADGAGGYGAQALPGPGGEFVQKAVLPVRLCQCPLSTTAYGMRGCSSQARRSVMVLLSHLWALWEPLLAAVVLSGGRKLCERPGAAAGCSRLSQSAVQCRIEVAGVLGVSKHWVPS